MSDYLVMLAHRNRAQARFAAIMRRHIEADDEHRTDDDLVRTVFKRYDHWREQPLIDPNE